jgi:ketosteroid isomerase-like protein
MSVEENVQIVKDFFAAMGGHYKQDLLALVAEDIEWIIPGEDWPLAGTHRGRAELAAVLKKASEEVETTYPKPPRIRGAGRPGSGRRRRYGDNQSHEQAV